MEWLVDDAVHPGADLSLARMTVYPGQTSPAHLHDNANEAIHVLSGHIEERLGEDWHAAAPGNTLFVPAETIHQTRCTSAEPAVMMIAYSTGKRSYTEVDI